MEIKSTCKYCNEKPSSHEIICPKNPGNMEMEYILKTLRDIQQRVEEPDKRELYLLIEALGGFTRKTANPEKMELVDKTIESSKLPTKRSPLRQKLLKK